jgi:hypothetical protein
MIGLVDGVTTEHSHQGWEALRAGEWSEARAAFEAALVDGETPATLDGLGSVTLVAFRCPRCHRGVGAELHGLPALGR